MSHLNPAIVLSRLCADDDLARSVITPLWSDGRTNLSVDIRGDHYSSTVTVRADGEPIIRAVYEMNRLVSVTSVRAMKDIFGRPLAAATEGINRFPGMWEGATA